jgi:porphobilinogen deaminase
MDGGCSSPISSFAKMNGKNLTFEVGITCLEAKKSIQIKEDFDNNDSEAYLKIYKLLMKKGGDKILYQIKK